MIVEHNSQPPPKMENKLLFSCPLVKLISDMALSWQRPKNKQTHTATYLNKESISKLTRLKKKQKKTEGQWCKTLVTVLVVYFILNFTSLCVSSQQAKQPYDVINENHCGAVGVFWSVWWLSHHGCEQHFISVFRSVQTKSQKPAVLLLVNAMQCSIWIKKIASQKMRSNQFIVLSLQLISPASCVERCTCFWMDVFSMEIAIDVTKEQMFKCVWCVYWTCWQRSSIY